ncbi:polyadenylate-binding protein 1 [Moniliophthora roreri MCA 2997]|uniref:Polyadenylate-binding protein 1 n=1 Tax=Moniliophthora roreri (strain MCA 2997) TaxID=1381753 RepID=V2XFP5_MONRO|nr:polyadenylate-binding protein 1 [Moniliophthora roreri MCA 2997]
MIPYLPVRKSHPYLQKPSVFITKLPNYVKLDDITALFQDFADISVALKKTPTRRFEEESVFARIEFLSLDRAEKAMAILQEQEIPNTTPLLRISFSTNLIESISCKFSSISAAKPRLLTHFPSSKTCGDMYDVLRTYGPIYTIYKDDILGILVQYWAEDDACEAELALKENVDLSMELQACDPKSIYVSYLPPDIDSHQALADMFKQFGSVVESLLVIKQGVSRGFGFVTFEKHEEASQAIMAMHGKKIRKKSLTVTVKLERRYRGARVRDSKQETCRPVTETVDPAQPQPDITAKTEDKLSDPVENEKVASGPVEGDFVEDATLVDEDVDVKQHGDYLLLNAKLALAEKTSQAWKEESDCLRAEMEDLRIREASVLSQLENVRDSNSKLREELTRRNNENASLKDQLRDVREAYDEANRAIEDLQESFEELAFEEKYLNAETERLQSDLANSKKEVERLTAALDAEIKQGLKAKVDHLETQVSHLTRTLELSESRRKLLELETDRPKWEEARKVREAKEKEEELGASRRRMQKLQAEEAERKRMEAEHAQAKMREESERKKRLEEERKAREKAERERIEKERQEKLRREQAWRSATLEEKARLRRRDAHQWGRGNWNEAAAVARFQQVVDEFEKTKFSELKPLTYEAIPWPVPVNPMSFVLEEVQWDVVEKFFNVLRRHLDHAAYRALLDRTHRLFHPDRWKARGISKTIMDAELRSGVEDAGNVVSQAITPLWRTCKESSN